MNKRAFSKRSRLAGKISWMQSRDSRMKRSCNLEWWASGQFGIFWSSHWEAELVKLLWQARRKISIIHPFLRRIS
jgi:hypothetical protein